MNPLRPARGGGTATLNMHSVPVSEVVLDGKSLGGTPKVGVAVAPGSHSITFVHPDLGRQTTTLTVKAGETRTITVHLK